MRDEWAQAGLGRRMLFGLAAVYWIGVLVLFGAAVVTAGSAYESGLALGFYFTPLLFAAIGRGLYKLLSSRRPRPRFWSWWLLVIGAAIGLLLTIQRVAAAMAERAS